MSITLDRSGKRPITFEGKKFCDFTGHQENGPCNTRYWDIVVYLTESGKWVLSLEWYTNWQSEEGYREATVFDTVNEIADYLEGFDPIGKLVGYPTSNDKKYADRQRHVEQTIQGRWNTQVSETLAVIGAEETIE